MLTLTEASKLIQNPLQRGVVETFARTSPVLERLPFMDVNGNAYSYNVEQTLPGIAFGMKTCSVKWKIEAQEPT